ncbi:hypothetical protein D3C77_171240 [compost metagenome]
MLNQNEARGLIATKSAQLEEQLRKAGATGTGLKELSTSIGHLFDESATARIRKVYEFRNKAIHDHGFFIGQSALDRYVANVESVIHILEPRPGSDAYFRQKFAETDYVDDEMYQWALEEGKRRIAERQAQKAEISPTIKDQAVESSGPGVPPKAELDPEVIRKQRLDELKNRQLAREMDVKGAARSGLSPQTKEKIRDGAITVGLHLLASMFKR